MSIVLNEPLWVARCALRLREEWPRLAGSDLAEVAEQIWVEERWRDLEPEVAAVQWLRQGIPTVAPDVAGG